MQCEFCRKRFRQDWSEQRHCSIECWNRAQLNKIKSTLPTMKLYYNGEEVKTIKNLDIKGYNYETSALYSDHA